MWKQLLSILLLASALSPSAFAQRFLSVRDDPDYVWGEGMGSTAEEAEAAALADLSSRICVCVRSDFRSVEQQQRGSRGMEWTSLQSNRTDTRSHVTIYGSQGELTRKGKLYYARRWIRRDTLEGMFRERERRALEYERRALDYEGSAQVGDALRYHWWAYMMLRSLMSPSEPQGADGEMLLHSIPDRIDRILGDIRFLCVSRNGDLLNAFVFFRGQEVRALNYSWFDGADWRHGGKVTGGRTSMPMAPGALAEHVPIRIDYAGRSEAMIDNELSCILSGEDTPPLRKATIIIGKSK